MQFLRALSTKAEFAIVIGGAYGLFILSGLNALLNPTAGAAPAAEIALPLFHELLALVLLGAFLHLRGWTLKGLGVGVSPKETLIGFALAIAAILTSLAAWNMAGLLWPQAREAVEAGAPLFPQLSLGAIVAFALVNALFEELFVCGYVVTVVKERSDLATAVAVSVGIRLLYQFHYGAFGIAGLIPIGLIFAYWYARTGRLWPVLVAHTVLQIAILLPETA
jgi:uncharacterized protein